MLSRYSPVIEAQMRAFYQSLSEKDRRRYAAVEVCKLDRGGLSYIANVLGCDRHTIAQGYKNSPIPTRSGKHASVRKAAVASRVTSASLAWMRPLFSGAGGSHRRFTDARQRQVDQSHAPRDC